MGNILFVGIIGFILGLSIGTLIMFKMTESLQNQLNEIEKDLEILCSKS